VREDAGDHARIGDGRHQAQPPAAVRTRQDVEAEGPAQELGPGDVLGLFVRSLVGMDREAAKEALASFLRGKVPSANQIEFINLIVDYLTEHGVMPAERLYESPFTDLTPRGPDGIFSPSELGELLAVLDEVRATAVAA
jgi:type I restriction enzyme R subunit